MCVQIFAVSYFAILIFAFWSWVTKIAKIWTSRKFPAIWYSIDMCKTNPFCGTLKLCQLSNTCTYRCSIIGIVSRYHKLSELITCCTIIYRHIFNQQILFPIIFQCIDVKHSTVNEKVLQFRHFSHNTVSVEFILELKYYNFQTFCCSNIAIINCPYVFVLRIIDQQQDSALQGCSN